jgi:hypothetical protein
MFFFTPYFYVGIILIIASYFITKNTFNEFNIYTDYIEAKNLISTKKIKLTEFKKAKLIYPDVYTNTITRVYLKTKKKVGISFSPLNKYEALEVVEKLENFGIEFIKCKRYRELKKWGITKSGEDSYWH